MTRIDKPNIRELYPQLSEDEAENAEENLQQYLALVLRIFECVENGIYPQPDQLTSKNGTLPCTPPTEGVRL